MQPNKYTFFFSFFKEKRGNSFCSDLALSHLPLSLEQAGKENFKRLEGEPDGARDSLASLLLTSKGWHFRGVEGVQIQELGHLASPGGQLAGLWVCLAVGRELEGAVEGMGCPAGSRKGPPRPGWSQGREHFLGRVKEEGSENQKGRTGAGSFNCRWRAEFQTRQGGIWDG